MSVWAFIVKEWKIIYLTINKLLQIDRLGIKPYCFPVRKEEQNFGNFERN